MDSDYSVFSILPPYNVVQAQVIDPTGMLITDGTTFRVTYEGIADADGSLNTTSIGKTNFWVHVPRLFGVSLADDMGLAGYAMPGASNQPQAMAFDTGLTVFVGDGVPITPFDDSMSMNTYPMMRISVQDSGGTLLASTDVVLPVSDEMDCRACHASGGSPDAQPFGGWVWDSNPERDYRLNILKLHHDLEGSSPDYVSALSAAGYNSGGLYVTAATDGVPILCARCHRSNALPGTGIADIPELTISVHGFHAHVQDPTSGGALGDATNRAACYRCHPGAQTRCLRGAMGNATLPSGDPAIECQSCHGSMAEVGAPARTGWLEEPNCQSCHTGTAVSNSGQIRYLTVFDIPGVVRQVGNRTFATSPDTPSAGFSLYRLSRGHGGLVCEACHGSTHAEFPSSQRNDNVQSMNLQGHAGMLVECDTCHVGQPNTVTGGPHGLHPLGQTWVDTHPDVVQATGPAQCRACHGPDYTGTVLSRAQNGRSLSTEAGTEV
jgi:hypothetical protein